MYSHLRDQFAQPFKKTKKNKKIKYRAVKQNGWYLLRKPAIKIKSINTSKMLTNWLSLLLLLTLSGRKSFPNL